MFENPGGKMKTTANILFWLGLVGTVILAFVFGKDKYGDFEFFSFFIIAVAGAVSSYISSLVLYGIGDAIEDIARTRYIAASFYEREKAQPPKASTNRNTEIQNAGGWQCTCGRTNAGHVYICACGKNKSDVKV